MKPNVSIGAWGLGIIVALLVIPSCAVLFAGNIKAWEQQLTTIRDDRKEQLLEFYQHQVTVGQQIAADTRTEELYTALADYGARNGAASGGLFPVAGAGYRALWEDGAFLEDIMDAERLYDIFLIDADYGHVMYNVSMEADLGECLASGSLADSNLAECWNEVVATDEPFITDIASYAPSGGWPAQFAGVPLFIDGKLAGAVVLQINTSDMDEILADPTGLATTGEVIVVGDDSLMRSNSRLGPEATALLTQVNTSPAQEGLAGNTGFMAKTTDYDGSECLAAYTFIDLPYSRTRWAVLAEIYKPEARNIAPVMAPQPQPASKQEAYTP
jgi:hypothetical protein